MTPEEKERYERVERQLEFLANHQAQLAADLESLKEIVQNHSTQIAKNSAQIGQLGEFILRIGRIVEEQARVADERMARTDEQMARTDERLNTLINVVERYITKRGNGNE